ncbi:MAG: DMT family transporter [Acidovorax sp.]|uniref:DMT family transporter n=1 Tax=Acidovorax sp. TaxID=1872122 RepID=UPI00261E4870|nr:DMT family transporter [Acidovorax sp.]MDH4426445.1 DMT family transporter [Acidovorax sp.]
MTGGSLSPVLRGGLLALLAAALFGLSTPLVQLWGRGVGPFTTAGLLYGGAGLVALFLRRPKDREAQLQRSDAGRLLAMALFGAVIGPVALVWGLQRTSGTSASLMLTLEALFTALLAWRLYNETVDRRVVLAMASLMAGGVVLAFDQSLQGTVQLLGLAAVMVATAAWGVDNTLSRGVADRDPGQVVLAKSGLGVIATFFLAVLFAEPLPTLLTAGVLLGIGATGYGLSLRFYLLAQRTFGAARTGSVFAFAPLMGAVGAFGLGERAVSALLVLGGMLMLAGVVLHLIESHDHAHAHEALEHEHAHAHDDGHHDHDHDHERKPQGTHSHLHKHAALVHRHPHVPDLHHGHKH